MLVLFSYMIDVGRDTGGRWSAKKVQCQNTGPEEWSIHPGLLKVQLQQTDHKISWKWMAKTASGYTDKTMATQMSVTIRNTKLGCTDLCSKAVLVLVLLLLCYYCYYTSEHILLPLLLEHFQLASTFHCNFHASAKQGLNNKVLDVPVLSENPQLYQNGAGI